MIDISRHKELFDAETFKTPVTIIGAGATGSWLALALAKLGIEDITVYDFDTVEEHNIANQAFSIDDVGKKKVKALWDIIYSATHAEIKIQDNKFTNQNIAGIVFLMVDSMEQRKLIWENAIKLKPNIKLLIEPRMGLDVGRVYNVIPYDMTHIKKYENTYYDDDTAELSACGNTMSVISSALGITSWCVRQLIEFNNQEEIDNEILIDFKFNNIITSRW